MRTVLARAGEHRVRAVYHPSAPVTTDGVHLSHIWVNHPSWKGLFTTARFDPCRLSVCVVEKTQGELVVLWSPPARAPAPAVRAAAAAGQSSLVRLVPSVPLLSAVFARRGSSLPHQCRPGLLRPDTPAPLRMPYPLTTSCYLPVS